MFRRYRLNRQRRNRLRRRLAPKSRSILKLDDFGGYGESWEDVACDLADVEAEIADCRACLSALTRQERRFVEARYFEGYTIAQVARDLGVSLREVYRLRQSVVVKSAFILGRVAVADFSLGNGSRMAG